MNTRNSKATCWIDTHRVTLCEMEADVSYHADDLRQGRDSQNRVHAFSILAGKPIRSVDDNKVRGFFWRSYFYSIAGIAAMSALLAFWPK